MTLATMAYFPLAPVSASATSAQANYPAANVLTQQVRQPWKSTSLAAQSITLDLGASTAIACIAFSDCNFAACTIRADNSVNPATVIGSPGTGQDGAGRNKCSLLPVGLTARYISITPTGATLDGAAGYQIGAVYAFAVASSLARDPLFGSTQVDYNSPQSILELDNGVTISDDTGPGWALVTMGFSGGRNDDMESLWRFSRFGTVWLNLDGTPASDNQWPVRHYEPKITRRLQSFNREQVQFALKEQV